MKKIQWQDSEMFGEEKVFAKFGDLHIEMTVLKCLGDLLDNSGWVDILTQSGIATCGSAESFIKVSHIKRTRNAHEITASVLNMLESAAYERYIEGENVIESMSIEAWRIERMKVSPQFKFWNLILNLQLKFFAFLYSIRTGNLKLYIEALTSLVTLFFALDHNKYARWISVHIKDLKNMPESVKKEFLKGNFTVSKKKNCFSNMALDQNHEQMNAIIKGDGGAVGLTGNPNALKRWILAGPEISRIVYEFENSEIIDLDDTRRKHHEEYYGYQSRFYTNVKNLLHEFNEFGNPFDDKSSDLTNIVTKMVANKTVVDTIYSIEQTGKEAYEQFCTQRLTTNEVNFETPIKKLNLNLFKKQPIVTKSKDKLHLQSIKDDVKLFASMFILYKERGGDVDSFFEHENHLYPPSISDYGNLRTGTKCDLMTCLKENIPDLQNNIEIPDCTAVIIDGSVMVHMVAPDKNETFQSYADKFYKHLIKKWKVRRMDVVWDRYFPQSIKNSVRSDRGNGPRQHVKPLTKIVSWKSFLLNSDNKNELFKFLANQVTNLY